MDINWLTNAFITLFVTIDPVGLAPIFLALTNGMSTSERRYVALRASLIAGCLLITFSLLGGAILTTLGITLPAFRIAGGLMLFWIAFEMVFAKRSERKSKAADRTISIDEVRNIAVFPLAIPLMSGPGAISAVILLSGSNHTLAGHLTLIGVILLMMLGTYLVFFASEKIDQFLGETGRVVLTRLLGVLLAALSVQFVIDGIKESFAL